MLVSDFYNRPTILQRHAVARLPMRLNKVGTVSPAAVLLVPLIVTATLLPAGFLLLTPLAVYLLLTVICGAELFLLLRLLSTYPPEQTVPTVLIALIFAVGYYYKFLTRAYLPTQMLAFLGISLNDISWGLSGSEVTAVLLTTQLGFAGLLCGCHLALGGARKHRQVPRPRTPCLVSFGVIRMRLALTLLIGLGLAFATSYVIYATGATIMVGQKVQLPYRLTGIVFYSRMILIPVVFSTALIYAIDMGRPIFAGLAAGLLLGHGLADAVLRTSKLTFAYMVVFVIGTVYFGRGKHMRSLLAYVLPVGAVYFLIFSLMGSYRDQMAASRNNFSLAQEHVSSTFGLGAAELGASLGRGLVLALDRIPGYDMLAVAHGCCESGVPFKIEELLNGSEAGNYFSIAGFGYTAGYSSTAVAPSLLGFFYIYGGRVSVFFGMLAYAWLAQSAWRWLASLQPQLGQGSVIAKCCFCIVLYETASEGMLDDAYVWFVKLSLYFVSILGASYLLKRWAGQSRNVRV